MELASSELGPEMDPFSQEWHHSGISNTGKQKRTNSPKGLHSEVFQVGKGHHLANCAEPNSGAWEMNSQGTGVLQALSRISSSFILMEGQLGRGKSPPWIIPWKWSKSSSCSVTLILFTLLYKGGRGRARSEPLVRLSLIRQVTATLSMRTENQDPLPGYPASFVIMPEKALCFTFKDLPVSEPQAPPRWEDHHPQPKHVTLPGTSSRSWQLRSYKKDHMLKSPQEKLCPAIGQKEDLAGKYPYTALEKGRSSKYSTVASDMGSLVSWLTVVRWMFLPPPPISQIHLWKP